MYNFSHVLVMWQVSSLEKVEEQINDTEFLNQFVFYVLCHSHSYQVSLIHSETHFFQYSLTFSLSIRLSHLKFEWSVDH